MEQFENLMVVEVREGTDKPYRCSTGFYNRTGPNAQKMNRDEIVEFVKAEGKVRFDELIKRDFSTADFDEVKFRNFLKLSSISPVMETSRISKTCTPWIFNKARSCIPTQPCCFLPVI